MFKAPTRMASAASSRSISVASAAAGACDAFILEPASVGKPATSNRFLTAKGAPASGPRVSPRARRASMAAALARARSATTAVKPLSREFSAPMRASDASTIAMAVVSPARTARAIDAALDASKERVMA